jgi:hypothetical protein
MAFKQELSLITIPYAGERHPDTVTIEEALEKPEAGTNCQLLVLALARAMGHELPPLRSAELFTDTNYTEFVSDIENARTGNIIFLTKDNQTDPRWFHVGILSRNDEKELILYHNARHVGYARTEKLAEAMEDPRYKVIAGVKKLTIKHPEGPNLLFLASYGLEDLTK